MILILKPHQGRHRCSNKRLNWKAPFGAAFSGRWRCYGAWAFVAGVCYKDVAPTTLPPYEPGSAPAGTGRG